MTTIRMETENVETTLHHLVKTNIELNQAVDQMKRHRVKIQINWYGDKASAAFYTDLEKSLNHLATFSHELQLLEQRLRLELAQWIDADALFSEGYMRGGETGAIDTVPIPAPTLTVSQLQQRMCGGMSGAEQDRCLLIWGNPPTNAEQLAFMIQSLPEDLPIVIMQIGDGEYLVLMRGTTPGSEEGSNWGSAIEAMFGDSSYQNSVVAALGNANLPQGAKLHFAGHSQGGMIAQNLAVDSRVTSQFSVESVTMYGSPDTFAPANPDVRYMSYEAPGDIVPHLDEVIESMIGFDVTGRFNDVSAVAENHIIMNTRDAWNLNPFVSHRVYDDPGLLSGHEIPFQSDSWQAVAQEGTQISTLGPDIYGGIKEAADAVVSRLEILGVI